MRSLFFFGVIVCVCVVFVSSCKTKPDAVPHIGRYYTGVLFGRPFSIDVVGDSLDYQASIDSIIRLYEMNFNALDKSSVISRINAFSSRDSVFTFNDSSHVFGLVYDIAKDLHRKTLQYFDPTTAPLKRAWLVTKSRKELEPNLDSLFEFTGFDHSAKGDVLIDLNELTSDGYVYTTSQIRKTDPRVELDFTLLAGAAALDAVSSWLNERNVPQFRIKYGRSVICAGKPLVDTLHVVPTGIGFDTADQYIRFTGAAYAARSSQDKLGMIDPTYGYPVTNEMVYVSVVAPSLVEAEVFSEAFIIMGLERASGYYSENEDSRIQSFMLYESDKQLQSASTEGFDRLLLRADTTDMK
ncbi:MAG: FAD:protein FMN transferase [Flavobacteriales bacterium]